MRMSRSAATSSAPLTARKPQARPPSSDCASSVSIRRAVSASIVSAAVRSRKCERSEETAMTVSGPPQTTRSAAATSCGSASPTRIGTISNGAGSIAWSITRCISSECSPANGRGIDEDARRRLGELGVRNRRDLRFAQRRPPFRRRMDRDPAEGDPVGRTDDHDPARRLGALRPRTKGGRRDRAGIDDARHAARSRPSARRRRRRARSRTAPIIAFSASGSAG